MGKLAGNSRQTLHSSFRPSIAHAKGVDMYSMTEAVALTDTWDFTDSSLCSALGIWDGNMYKADTYKSEASASGVGKWVAPVLKAKL